MTVYSVQPAEAASKMEDPDRPLTPAGRGDARLFALLAAKIGVKVERLIHSGKLRAQETAVILAETLSPPKGVEEHSGLGLVDDIRPLAKELGAASRS